MKIAALDISSTCTGVVIGDANRISVTNFPASHKGKSPTDRIKRYIDLSQEIFNYVLQAGPITVYCEGYSFGSGFRASHVGEMAGILKSYLLEGFAYNIIEVPPASWKCRIFGKGQGHAKKDKIKSILKTKYGFTADTQDEYDAFGIYLYALTELGTPVEELVKWIWLKN